MPPPITCDLTLYLNGKIYNLIDTQKYNKSMKSLLSIETLHKSFSVKAEVIPVW